MIHPTSVVDTCHLGSGAEVGAYAVIGDGAMLGAGCVIHSNVVVGAGATVGDRTLVGDGAAPRVVKRGSAREAFDLAAYEQRVRADAAAGRCFICEIVAGARDDHLVVHRDDVCIAFLARFATLDGYVLVAPLEHRTGVVADFTEDEYVEVQRRVHRIGRALSGAVPTERLYVLSLGSMQGNAHVHWHVAALPPGVPYAEQQYAALMAEHGVVARDADTVAWIAGAIRAELAAGGG